MSDTKTDLTTVDYFAYATSLWAITVSSSLIFFPRLITTVLLPYENHKSELLPKTELNPFERFLTIQLAIALVCSATLLLQLTGALNSNPIRQPSPYRISTVSFATTSLVISLFFTLYTNSSELGYLKYVHLFPVGLLSLWGLLIMIFGEELSKKSKTTGKDKRTSSYPFFNREAHSQAKKKS